MASNLADIRARTLDLLKRRDVPMSTLDRWITDSVRRIQRSLRTPMDEAVTTAVVPPGFNGLINIPSNMVELISIRADGRELEMRSTTEIGSYQTRGLAPARYYEITAGQYRIAPTPPAGTKIQIYYRADWTAVLQPTDNIKLFDVAGDLVCFGALLQAADWSIDPDRMAMWNSEYNAIFVEIQDLADRAQLQNASMAPCYHYA